MRGRTCVRLIAVPRSNRRCRASATSQGLASAMSQCPANAMRQRPPLDRNQRFGDSQRHAAGRAALGHGPRIEMSAAGSGRGAAAMRGPPPSAIRPPGGVPARAPGAADVPRSPGMWSGNRGAARVTPASVRRGPPLREPSATTHGDGPVATMSHRRRRRIPGRACRGARNRSHVEALREVRSRGPDGTREFRAAPRHQDAQRDWTPASPDARVPGPGITRPAAAIPRMSDAPRGPRNGSGFGPR